MRYMQIIRARDIEDARRSYLEMLASRGIVLAPATEVYVETVHRSAQSRDTWLCYIALPRPRAA